MISSYLFQNNTFMMTPSAMLDKKCSNINVILHIDKLYYCRDTLGLMVII